MERNYQVRSDVRGGLEKPEETCSCDWGDYIGKIQWNDP